MTFKTKGHASKDTVKDNARMLAFKVIDEVFSKGAYSNIALNRALSSARLDDLDRRFATELVYGCVKAKGTLDWIIAKHVTRPLNKISPVILNILRLGVFQIYYLERIPASAACNESVNLAKKLGHQGTVKFVNAVLRSSARGKDTLKFPSEAEDSAGRLALELAHPRWLVERWLNQFGKDQTVRLCVFNNQPPPLTLRVNSLKANRDELLAALLSEGFEAAASAWSADGIVCTKVPSMKLLFERYGQSLYVQDESSMLIAGILAPLPGQLVIDVCAAPGGKTTHLAQLMENKGTVIATDIYEHKLKLIAENARRLGLDIVRPLLGDAAENVTAWNETADRVLVDAPCSGLGVLARRAEARWNKTEESLKEFPALQSKILANASRYVKPGGRLVYSTCTLEKAENGEVVDSFLREHKDFCKKPFRHPLTGNEVEELSLLPQKDGIDGFYICALERQQKDETNG